MSRKLRQLNFEFPIHISARSNNREAFPLPLDQVWEILSDYLFILHSGFGFQIISFVLMPNHFHLIALDPLGNLSEGMEYFMRETSREIGKQAGRINRIWGGRFHSTIIGDPIYFINAYKYVYRNPVDANICPSVTAYPYSTLAILLGQIPGIIPILNDETLFSNETKTLEWLNEGQTEDERECIRKALKRKYFEFKPIRKTRKKTSLTDWDSVPEFIKTNLKIGTAHDQKEAGAN